MSIVAVVLWAPWARTQDMGYLARTGKGNGLSFSGNLLRATDGDIAITTITSTMTSHPDEPQKLHRKLLRELTTWVHRQNTAPRSESAWDRPIVITLIGSVLLGLLTTAWQTAAKRREIALMYKRTLIDEQMQLLKELPRIYEHIGETVNSWFATVIWIAEETNKTQDTRTAQNIAEWKKKTADLEAIYGKAEPLTGLLARISVVYASPSVRSGAPDLSREWKEFVDAFQTLNRKWNASQQLSAADIQTAKDTRLTRLSRLEDTEKELMEKMTAELFSSRGTVG